MSSGTELTKREKSVLELASGRGGHKPNRYAKLAQAEVRADMAEENREGLGEQLQDEIDVLRQIITSLMAGATRETFKDPEKQNQFIAAVRTIALTADIKNKIDTSEQYVFTHAAAKKFASNMREAVRRAVEEGVMEVGGRTPPTEVAQTGAAIWQAVLRNIDRMKMDARANSVPLMLSEGEAAQ